MRAMFASILFAALPISAQAAQVDTIKINVTPADLRSEESLAALLKRIETAAKDVCYQTNNSLQPLDRTAGCESVAVKDAIDDAKIQALSDYYASLDAPKAKWRDATLASR